MDNQIKYIDLFCGIGSFHYSFKKFGWKCVMACDIDDTVKKTYENNYGVKPLDDITTIEPSSVPNYDILCAGFPCQPWSQCGKQEGFNDIRGTIFYNIIKFVKYHQPKIIILENVQGLLTHDNGNSFSKMKLEIENENYIVKHTVLKCSDYGLPQMRKRLIIIAIRKDFKLVDYIDNLLDFTEYKKEMSLSNFLNKKFEKKHAYTIRCGGRNSPINDRHNWDGYLIDNQVYRLTIDDALKLQGYTNFKLYGSITEQWKQLGNTIPTIFTEIIAKNIKKYLNSIQ